MTVNYTVAAVAPESGTPTGQVIVGDGVDSCTASVAAGGCTLTLTTAGARTLKATYLGNPAFQSSTSAEEAHTVNGLATSSAITAADPDPSVVGEPVTVHYSVSPSDGGGGTPTGNVTVSDGTTSCTATVAAGRCVLAFAGTGARSLTASYAGNSTFAASTSAVEPHTVSRATTVTTLTADGPDPSTKGTPVTVRYSVTVSAPGAGTPTGTVRVTDGIDSCTATVAAGRCTIALTTVGRRTLTAAYAGDDNFSASSSSGSAAHRQSAEQLGRSATHRQSDGRAAAHRQTGEHAARACLRRKPDPPQVPRLRQATARSDQPPTRAGRHNLQVHARHCRFRALRLRKAGNRPSAARFADLRRPCRAQYGSLQGLAVPHQEAQAREVHADDHRHHARRRRDLSATPVQDRALTVRR